MKKNVLTLIILVAVVLTAVVTCPNQEAHKTAVMNELNDVINTSMSKEMMNKDDGWEKGFAALGSMFASKIAESFIETTLKVNNYFVCSTGQVTVKDSTKTVSFGAFGHVFTLFSSADIEKVMNE